MARKRKSGAAKANPTKAPGPKPVDTDTRPETSPYGSPSCTIPFASPLTVPLDILKKSPKLQAAYESRLPELPAIPEGVGHVLVHYLHTGTYESLRPRPTETMSKQICELKTSIQAYAAARAYDLPDLMRQSEAKIDKYSHGLALPTLLEVARDAYPTLTEGDAWFLNYLRTRIRPHLKDPQSLLASNLLDQISGILSPHRVLLRTVLELFCERITVPAPAPAPAPVPAAVASPLASPITSPGSSRPVSPLPPITSSSLLEMRSRSIIREEFLTTRKKRATPWPSPDAISEASWSQEASPEPLLPETVPPQVEAKPVPEPKPRQPLHNFMDLGPVIIDVAPPPRPAINDAPAIEREVVAIPEPDFKIAIEPETKVDEVRVEEPEVKVDEVKVDEIKVDEIKVDEIKVDEIKVDEIKVDEIKAEEPEVKEVKVEEPEVKVDEPEVKVDEPEVKVNEPEAKISEPEVKVDEPQVKLDESEVKTIEPEIKVDEAKVDESEVKVVEPQIKVDETEVDETKIDEIKVDEAKAVEPEVKAIESEIKVDEIKVDEIKVDEIKVIEPEIEVDEIKVIEPEVKVDEIKVDEIKLDEPEVKAAVVPEPEATVEPEIKQEEPLQDPAPVPQRERKDSGKGIELEPLPKELDSIPELDTESKPQLPFQRRVLREVDSGFWETPAEVEPAKSLAPSIVELPIRVPVSAPGLVHELESVAQPKELSGVDAHDFADSDAKGKNDSESEVLKELAPAPLPAQDNVSEMTVEIPSKAGLESIPEPEPLPTKLVEEVPQKSADAAKPVIDDLEITPAPVEEVPEKAQSKEVEAQPETEKVQKEAIEPEAVANPEPETKADSSDPVNVPDDAQPAGGSQPKEAQPGLEPEPKPTGKPEVQGVDTDAPTVAATDASDAKSPEVLSAQPAPEHQQGAKTEADSASLEPCSAQVRQRSWKRRFLSLRYPAGALFGRGM